MQKVIITSDIKNELSGILANYEYDRLNVICDKNSRDCCYINFLMGVKELRDANLATIEPGDEHKNLDSLSWVWEKLGEYGATRKSLVINIGGGMVTDLGGFAASTFKRGLRFINIPTTLLAMVDASVGGKTGINFHGLKNEIGVFSDADYVILDTVFLKTLDSENICSGYAEMLKHGLISNDDMWRELVTFDILNPDLDKLRDMVADSVKVKQRIVEEDPHEHGIRRALNLGHTAAHAFESFAMQQNAPIAHGYAVAWGLIIDAVLSHFVCSFDSKWIYRIADFVLKNYGAFRFTCDDYDALIQLMRHDKKSRQGEINCTLLGAPGDIRIDCEIAPEVMKEAFDLYRDLMHI